MNNSEYPHQTTSNSGSKDKGGRRKKTKKSTETERESNIFSKVKPRRKSLSLLGLDADKILVRLPNGYIALLII